MNVAEMKAIRRGYRIVSKESRDTGSVIRVEPTGLLIRWNFGIKEFLSWGYSKTISLAQEKKHARMSPDERRAAIRRVLTVQETMPRHEQERILREIAALQEARRRVGHIPRARPSERLYQEPVYVPVGEGGEEEDK